VRDDGSQIAPDAELVHIARAFVVARSLERGGPRIPPTPHAKPTRRR
jgi:hypothetical protein